MPSERRKSSTPELQLEALFSCQGSAPWRRLSILEAAGDEDPMMIVVVGKRVMRKAAG